jgi:hypothetical protein
MTDKQYKIATEIKKEIENINSSLFDLNHAVFNGGLIYIPNNPEIIHNIKIALEEERVKLRRKFENL